MEEKIAEWVKRIDEMLKIIGALLKLREERRGRELERIIEENVTLLELEDILLKLREALVFVAEISQREKKGGM